MTENKYISHELGLCGNECGYWSCVIWATWIKNEKDPAHLQKGKNGPSCTKGHCNPLEVVITNPLDPRWKKRGACDIRNQWGQTGSSSKYLGSRRSLQMLSWASVSNFLWWTKCASTRNSRKTRNLFLQLAEHVAQSLGVTSCYVCGGTVMGNQWPWEAWELVPVTDPVSDEFPAQKNHPDNF